MRAKSKDRGWRDWYQLERWRRIRRHQLLVEPVCRMCRAQGRLTPATIADHIAPHHGDWNAFILGALQSLCASCHDQTKRQIETRGYLTDVDELGWPIDPRHPANSGDKAESNTRQARKRVFKS